MPITMYTCNIKYYFIINSEQDNSKNLKFLIFLC